MFFTAWKEASMKTVARVLGIGNALLFATALLMFSVPAGFAAEEESTKGCWREDIHGNEFCCSWLSCDCGLLEFGECGS